MGFEAPLMFGIVFYFIYLTFELFVRKQERINLIEKMGQNMPPIDPDMLKIQSYSLLPTFKKSFTALRFGCLFAGLGFGLLVGLFIGLIVTEEFHLENNPKEMNNIVSLAYGASALCFGGLGLLISYLIENSTSKKNRNERGE